VTAPAPEDAAVAAAEGRSNLDIALRMFLRKRGAVAAAAFLAVLFALAVWTPLLATAAPLRFRGTLPGAAVQATRTARLELQDLADGVRTEGLRATPPWEPVKVEASLRVVAFQLGLAEEALAGEARARVVAIREDFAKAGPAPDPNALSALAGRLKALGKPGAADLATVVRWPALLALEAADLFFMAAFLALPAGLWLLRKGPGRPRRPRTAAVAVLAPALLAAATWAVAGPDGPDPTDYKGGIASGAVVAEAVTWAPIPFDLNENRMDRRFEAPGGGDGAHLLGTDENGRDLLCRMLWGARVSLSVGFVAVGIYVALGIAIGAVAGYYRGWVDIVISRFVEWVICFPVFVLILVIVAFLQDRTILGMDPPQILVVMVVIGITGWTTVARLVRAEFLRLVEADFVRAARALGARPARIIFGHVLPNAMGPVLVAAAFGVAGAILTESGLSFLGLGINVPRPSWGGMLNSARGYEQSSAWIVLWPGLAIFLVITCYNLVGEALRDALDPRLRQ
jgi:peptide/nickel transport system permease protein